MPPKEAVREKVPLRMLLDGHEGSGKTFTALKVMSYLVDGPIGFIDSERRRAVLYAPLPGEQPDPEKGTFRFWHYELNPPYSPEAYIAAINTAVRDGVAGIIIDSITHEWDGAGGVLEAKSKLDATSKGNSYTNWSTMTAKHNNFLSVLLNQPVHLIATGRVHQDHVIEEVDGRRTVRKAGLNLIQRDTTGYEFDVIGRMDHTSLTVTKAPNLESIQDKTFHKPGKEFAQFLNTWLGLGVKFPLSREAFIARMSALGYTDVSAVAEFVKQYPDVTGEDKYERLLELAEAL